MNAPDKTNRQIRVSVPDEPPRLTPDVARVLLRMVLAARSGPGPASQNQQERNK